MSLLNSPWSAVNSAVGEPGRKRVVKQAKIKRPSFADVRASIIEPVRNISNHSTNGEGLWKRECPDPAFGMPEILPSARVEPEVYWPADGPTCSARGNLDFYVRIV